MRSRICKACDLFKIVERQTKKSRGKSNVRRVEDWIEKHAGDSILQG